MRKDEAQELLNSLDYDLGKVREKIRRTKRTFITTAGSTVETELACTRWFEELTGQLKQFGISDDIQKKYDGLFTSLLELSTRPNRRSTYLNLLGEIQADFMDELYVPVTKSTGRSVISEPLATILEKATPEEANYLHEALGCAANGFRRASIVLGWNAAINRIHRVIEEMGFEEFNKKAESLKSESQGRFKRFNKLLAAHSISELRATVFDNDLLWVLEYWGLIDANQHERLEICFTMRNNSAHPGEAPITQENLASFYSDLRTMVFANPHFMLQKKGPDPTSI